MTEIALIGDTTNVEFSSLVNWLTREYPSTTEAVWRDIAGWERRGPSIADAQLTVILQSWSDEYAPAEVDRLVGATLTSGLYCCYGAWCEGDGRTREIWPHSTRVPVRYAREVLQEEILRIEAGRPAIPPTAARDEVFLRRQLKNLRRKREAARRAVVISADRAYRTTLAQVLSEQGWDAESVSLGPGSLLGQRSPQLVIHDLDPDSERVQESLSACRARFPGSRLCGVASFPGDFSREDSLDVPVVPRLDPMTAVAQIERLVLSDRGRTGKMSA